MREQEGGSNRGRGGARGAVRHVGSEELLERGVGEPLRGPAQAPLAISQLRPQQGRNVVWRWHVRRRQRAG
jgi:hypothetical protein